MWKPCIATCAGEYLAALTSFHICPVPAFFSLYALPSLAPGKDRQNGKIEGVPPQGPCTLPALLLFTQPLGFVGTWAANVAVCYHES